MSRSVRRLTATAVGLVLAGLAVALGQEAARPVNLKVLLPYPTAQLTIEGKSTLQTGPVRTFVSPPLLPGKEYTYTLVATWAPNNYTTITRKKEVPVRGGQDKEIDLRQADDSSPDKVFVRYVPTPPDVVQAMIKLGKMTPEDVVYDLGCGDGRMVIGAVKAGAKRGVGIDLDPKRVAESQVNAKTAGVEDRVEFRKGDILDIKDLSNASLVLIYLGDDLNMRLRPVLQKTLKPGSRIVSHRFQMGDWKPVKSETMTGEDGDTYELHLWIVGQ